MRSEADGRDGEVSAWVVVESASSVEKGLRGSYFAAGCVTSALQTGH